MNIIEETAINIPGKDRFEKRDNLARWIDSFIKSNSECKGCAIERVYLPNNEYMQRTTFFAYSRYYVWIDYLRNDMLDTSRLEYIDEEQKAHILFEDDFGVVPAFDTFNMLATIYGIVRISR